ncbi:Hsp20/alpha crystallin family protein [bacterium]|nr:Hsp20/alpha crystallin family protein [bacterium]
MLRRTPVESPFARMIDRMIDHAAREHGPAFNGETFATDTALPMDIEETESHYLISADLPGVNPENINIDMHDGILTISAETKEESRSEKGRMVLQERRYGKFSRSMRFPVAVNADAIEASFSEGVLRVQVAKAAEAQPRRINVKTGNTISGSGNGSK